MLVPTSPTAAFGDDDALIRTLKVMHQGAGLVVVECRAHRHFQNRVHTLAAATIGPFSVASALCLVLGIEAEMNQGIVALARLHDAVAAATAISPGRSTPGHKFFAPEGDAAIATISCLHPDACFINEHGEPTS